MQTTLMDVQTAVAHELRGFLDAASVAQLASSHSRLGGHAVARAVREWLGNVLRHAARLAYPHGTFPGLHTVSVTSVAFLTSHESIDTVPASMRVTDDFRRMPIKDVLTAMELPVAPWVNLWVAENRRPPDYDPTVQEAWAFFQHHFTSVDVAYFGYEPETTQEAALSVMIVFTNTENMNVFIELEAFSAMGDPVAEAIVM